MSSSSQPLISPVNSTLKWGILGTGNIAGKFVDQLNAHQLHIVAAASRSAEKAQSFAQDKGIPQSYGTYEALLSDPIVDAVYISLPNHLHAEWSIKCAEAGKHVLCEKPVALDAAELERVLAAIKAADVFFMEAFMYRFHPQWDLVQKLIADGRIGDVRTLHASFCYNMGVALENIRQSRPAAGGGLMDVGCYCLSFLRMIAGEEPIAAFATGQIGAESHVDEWAAGTLKFSSGIIATFHTATRAAQPTLAAIYGDKGFIEVPTPWHPDGNEAKIRLNIGGQDEWLTAGDGLTAFGREALVVETYLADRQAPKMTWADSLAQADLLAKLRRSIGLDF
jgi:predicted dehydrogenase